MTDSERPWQEPRDGDEPRPNASPELQDAIRSIDAIGENASGKDDDQDVPRDGPGEPAATDPSPSDTPEANPDAP